jgi:hypothetical protein
LPAQSAGPAPLISSPQPASPFTLVNAGAPPASPEAGALRNYLHSASADMLCKSIFREQVIVPSNVFPGNWIKAVQDSMSEVAGRMVDVILSAAGTQVWSELIPPIDGKEDFDWAPLEALCGAAYKSLIPADPSMKLLPRPTMILLGQMVDELQHAPGFQHLSDAQRDKVSSDAIFGVAVFLGLIGPMQEQLKVKGDNHSRLGALLGIYLKACFGIASTSQGGIAGTIVKFAGPEQLVQCAAFNLELLLETRRIAGLRTVCFDHDSNDFELDNFLEDNIDVYFIGTWLARADDYKRQLAKGCYLLAKPDGTHHICRSYKEFTDYVGQGSKGTLAQTILHVSGERLKNFLCHTYLYGVRPLFTDIDGRSVDPIPKLQTLFLVRREASGHITVEYSCTDLKVGKAMLIGNNEEDQFEATPALPASLEFAGFWHFYPNEEFEVGRTRITGQNLHLFQ